MAGGNLLSSTTRITLASNQTGRNGRMQVRNCELTVESPESRAAGPIEVIITGLCHSSLDSSPQPTELTVKHVS